MSGHTHRGPKITQDCKNETTLFKQQHKETFPAMDNESVRQRLHYATSAKVFEGYPLGPLKIHTTSPVNVVTTYDLKPSLISSSSTSSKD